MTTSQQLESVLLADVGAQLEQWRRKYHDRPDLERTKLLMFALEREQIVAVAYREEAIAVRVAELEVDKDVQALIRQTLIWVWKDEQLHAEFMRGHLLHSRGVASSLVVYGRQLQGALSGWTTATRNLRASSSAPLRTGAAGALVAVAGVLGRVPPALRRELRYQTFRRYCRLNVALEVSAEFAYRRLVELAESEDERLAFDRIRADEERHAAAFRVLTDSLTDDDHAVDGLTVGELVTRLGEISPWFIPVSLRPPSARPTERRAFGSRQPVVVRAGRSDADKVVVLEESLDRAGLGELATGARSVAVRLSFMLGYDRRDMSNVNDPELVDALARYLRRHGVADVAILEVPTVYGKSFTNRSVESVADYFGFESDAYRVVDMHKDLEPFRFDRGFVQQALSRTWADADLRIVMPKLRTDPTEFLHLCLSTLEGSIGPIDETVYAERALDFRSATMMLLDVAPPDFAVVDCWSPVADGPFGVMGCRHPSHVRLIYAGADALSVDEVVLADLGIAEPRRAPIVARAYHWFGLSPASVTVDGTRPALGASLRGAHGSKLLQGLGAISYPIYVYLSDRGELFVPDFDTTAFPAAGRVSAPVRAVRWSTQRAFGLRPPEATA